MSKTSNTPNSTRPILPLAIGGLILLLGGGVFADYWSAKPAGIEAEFVGRSGCIDCHRDQAKAFEGSHHDLAMDVATDETVLGDFNDATFEHDGLVNRMYRDGERFMVHTEGPTGKMEDFEVKYVFGVTPLQQYMVEFDRSDDMPEDELSRLQVLRISWDTKAKRWFYLRPPDVNDKLEPDDPLHWTGIAQRWQTMCADCHSTNLKTNFDPKANRYHTTFSEIDVSCEACHGPGSLHVELANSKSLFWDRRYGYGLTKLKGEINEPQIQTCAPCHSRRGVLDGNFHGGDTYFDHYALELMSPATYHADGQIKDEVYVFGSFIQSKMYHKNIRCSDCHDPHSLELKHKGNETCTSCHQHAAGKYDVPSHHHHVPGTAGAMCVNCHMPHTTYMEVDPRRDHSLRIPRPDLSVKIGTPNACSSCHVEDVRNELDPSTREKVDEYADWLRLAEMGNDEVAAAIAKVDQWCDDACDKWYGEQRATPPHFGEAFAAFRAGEPDAVDAMTSLVTQTNDKVPAYARATALFELGQSGVADALPVARKVLKMDSEHPLVRTAAVTVYMTASPERIAKELFPFVDDEMKPVRNEATRVIIASGAVRLLDATKRSQVELAARRVKETLMNTADRAGAHMAWAALAEQLGRYGESIESYQDAIRVEPNTTGARSNFAELLDTLAQSNGPQAEEMRALAKQLRAAELPLIARDAGLVPDNAPMQYRYGLALYQSGKYSEALEQLEKAAELDPEVEVYHTAIRLLKEKIAEENEGEK
ncbi:tetratricopeptide repeat protein [Novipirellula caenicola]|uniref:tetratricopeptide repeat protein n=1 Tax=Novipirellula caenicola TaxID=1536901 RepID=UPI0031E976F0